MSILPLCQNKWRVSIKESKENSLMSFSLNSIFILFNTLDIWSLRLSQIILSFTLNLICKTLFPIEPPELFFISRGFNSL